MISDETTINPKSGCGCDYFSFLVPSVLTIIKIIDVETQMMYYPPITQLFYPASQQKKTLFLRLSDCPRALSTGYDDMPIFAQILTSMQVLRKLLRLPFIFYVGSNGNR